MWFDMNGNSKMSNQLMNMISAYEFVGEILQ